MEMFGMLGSVAGAGLGFMGAMENADAQREATQANFALNIYNAQMKDRWRAEAIAQALRQRREQQLGTTDIRGTRTHFIPGRGWVVEGADSVNQMIALQDAEQRKVLGHDLPQLRAQRDRNYQRSFGEEALADTFRRKLSIAQRVPDDKAYAQDLYDAQTMGLREAERNSTGPAFSNLFRTGAANSNIARAAGEMSRAKNDAYAKAALTARIGAEGHGQAIADSNQKNLANLYNLFATRAGNMPDVGYKPQSLDTKGQLDSAAAGMLASSNTAVGAFSKEGGQLDYVPANMGYGNALAGLGSSLGSAFRGMGARGGVSGFGGSGGDDAELYTGGEGEFYS